VAGRSGGDRVPGSRGAVARDSGAGQAEWLGGEARNPAGQRADSTQCEAEVGAAGESPVATGRPPSDGKAGIGQGHGGDAAVVGPALRFALSARPSGSQGFAPGKAHDKNKNENKRKDENQKQEKGTLLTR
jgi:hypothetical protein